jgi:hypothetical protein
VTQFLGSFFFGGFRLFFKGKNWYLLLGKKVFWFLWVLKLEIDLRRIFLFEKGERNEEKKKKKCLRDSFQKKKRKNERRKKKKKDKKK